MPKPLRSDFDAHFRALTGFPPFPWQRRLYQLFLENDIPVSCDLPTGMGKTSVVALWLLAKAVRPDALPNRLVYCVNRRTIVDQVSAFLLGLDERLQRHELTPVRDSLGELALSTLRGQLADNRRWMDPSRRGVVVATPDLAGSGLLFRGYRSGWKSWPFAAGLLGHDTLFVHDEAHLSVPFQRLIERVSSMQAKQTHGLPGNLKVMSLSATAAAAETCFTLGTDDLQDVNIASRIHAAKQLRLCNAGKPAAVGKVIAERALAYAEEAVRVIVYVRSPKVAATIYTALCKALGTENDAEDRVELLTGTLRGQERDQLAERPVLRRLLAPEGPGSEPLIRAEYLVSTSAGAVGADFDADHLVCDLVPADELVQRLGRVNRRGQRNSEAPSRIDVFCSFSNPKNAFEEAAQETAKLLSGLGADDDSAIDASPAAVREWVTPANRAPVPEAVHLSESQLDALTMTSVSGDWNAVPPIPSLIHGLAEDAPQTVIYWRVEAGLLNASASDHDVSEAVSSTVRSHRPLACERVQVPASEAAGFLAERWKKLTETPSSVDDSNDAEARIAPRQNSGQALLLPPIGDPRRIEFSHLAKTPDTRDLAGATLILPASFGGLSPAGLLDSGAEAPARSSLDIADEPGGIRRRVLLQRQHDTPARLFDIAGRVVAEAETAAGARVAARTLDGTRWRIRERVPLRFDPEEGTVALEMLLLTAAPTENTAEIRDVLLEDHADRVAVHARRIAAKVAPEHEILFRHLGRWHDAGKARARWQAACDNPAGGEPLAKSGGRPFKWRLLSGYRHELGSALDLLKHPGDELPPAGHERDLFLHVLLAHHGRARPIFRPGELLDSDHPGPLPDELTPLAVARRFERLQRRLGPWRLAFLESILRAADALASREEIGAHNDL